MGNVAKKTSTVVATTDLGAWGPAPAVESDDIVIPKLLAQQGMSKYVMDGVAKMGDICHSLTGEVLGGMGKPVKILPFHLEKKWLVTVRRAGANKFEYDHFDDVKLGEKRPFEQAVGDSVYRNELCRNFYALVEGHEIPFVVTFKSTSSRAGRVLATQMYVTNRAAGVSPAAKWIELGCEKVSNDRGTFVVMQVKPTENATAESQALALNWFNTVNNKEAKVDTSDAKTPVTDNSGVDDDLPF